ncbi:MAG: DUF1097 domain-containing protein [Clostridia bacterium]|nr:DUF1097 domain-containing protein [Clostridia bacterium]
MKNKLNADTWTLALGIALFPPLWAVIAPYLKVSTGAVALICAGLYVTNGNKRKDAVKISVGFLLGDFWAVAALKVMDTLKLNEDLELFGTLFVLGGLAVIISALVPKYIFCPAWLCGWAIGLTILAPGGWENVGTVPVQIGMAMLVGIWYVGVFVDLVQKKTLKFLDSRKEKQS